MSGLWIINGLKSKNYGQKIKEKLIEKLFERQEILRDVVSNS